MFDVFSIFIIQCCVCFEGLATLLEGAGYLFNCSSIKIYNLFNSNGEKCVKLANNALEVVYGLLLSISPMTSST